jgi:hypothetical protein
MFPFTLDIPENVGIGVLPNQVCPLEEQCRDYEQTEKRFHMLSNLEHNKTVNIIKGSHSAGL